MIRKLIVGAVACGTFLAPGVASAQPPADKEAPVTPATEWHGLPGNNAGFSDQANGACPATSGNPACDGGIHGIANNPGQSGVSPQEQGVPACNMHAGFNGVKKQCPVDEEEEAEATVAEDEVGIAAVGRALGLKLR